MKVWDLGGQERFRPEWVRYAHGCDCVIFCVDAHDSARLGVARRELHRLLEDRLLHGVPLLICLNKIDLEPHVGKEEAVRELNLDYITENPWVVASISALRHTNVVQVVDWLVSHSHA